MVPRVYVRVIRWMECVFVLLALTLLAFLPIPPHGAEIGSFAVLSTGIVGAGLVGWGLRSPTRFAWWGALALAAAWLLLSIKLNVSTWRVVALVLTGHAAMYSESPAFVFSYLFAIVPAMAQAVILVTWLEGNGLRT